MAHDPARLDGDSDLGSLTAELEKLESIFVTWEDHAQGAVAAYRRSIDALHREAFRRVIAAVRVDPAGAEALRSAVSDEVVYGVLRHLGLLKPSLQERLEAALESVRPMLATHGGNVQLVEVRAPDTVVVRFLGSCENCPASALTFVAGVKAAILAQCPEVVNIEQARGISSGPEVNFVSPFASADSARPWLPAGALRELPAGGVLAREVGGESVLLGRFDDSVVCYQNACAHLGMPLDMGEVAEGVLTCPYHSFRYDLRSGECVTAPAVQLHAHAVRVVGDRVEVRLSR